MPSFVFTEDYQVDLMQQYHEAFDGLRKKFLVGEMIWNFADFMTDECKLLGLRLTSASVHISGALEGICFRLMKKRSNFYFWKMFSLSKRPLVDVKQLIRNDVEISSCC